ncbi:MAG: Gfo/Idh/MocA family oxidoreductase [Micrococcales bacterium]|nr:Gfo/Idh/MocA family oxidoreductase [Micrococcales bacterium]
MSHIPDPMTAPPLRWGFLGTGMIARFLAEAARDGTTQILQAIGSRTQDKADAFAQKYNVPQAFGSYEELVACPDVDVVYIATPNSEHHANTKLALEAGKHVLVEKSFTLTQAQAIDLAELAKQKNLFITEAMWTRFLPHQIELRRRIANGDLGDLVAAAGDLGQRDPVDLTDRFYSNELGGGSLYDRGVYPILWIADLFGIPQTVQARAEMTFSGVDGHLSVILGYPDKGVHAVAQSSILARTPAAGWVAGTKGYCEVPGFWAPAPLHFSFADGSTETWQWEGIASRGYEYEMAAIARAITEGLLTHPLIPIEETIAIQGLFDEIRAQIGLTWTT